MVCTRFISEVANTGRIKFVLENLDLKNYLDDNIDLKNDKIFIRVRDKIFEKYNKIINIPMYK